MPTSRARRSSVTAYSQPRSARVTQVVEHPRVSLRLESDGFGGGVVAIGGTASVTAEGIAPRGDKQLWATCHAEAEALGMGEAIGTFDTRISIQPRLLWTSLPTSIQPSLPRWHRQPGYDRSPGR